MNNTLFIGWNGPKECGKDFSLNYLKEFYSINVIEAKTKLHSITQEFFNISEERYWEIYEDRSLKEIPIPEFRVKLKAYTNLCIKLGWDISLSGRDYDDSTEMVNLSIREAMIFISELIVKPTFGQDAFGQYLADSLEEKSINADASVGFVEEIKPVLNKVGSDNYLLMRIHGRGDYNGDSRSYIPDGVVPNTIDVYNTGTKEEFLNSICSIVREFINKREET